MATVTSASAVEPEAVDVPPAVEAMPSKAMSVLDGIRAQASQARENLYWDLPLPDTVPGGLALRLGVPNQIAESTLMLDAGRASSVDNDLADLSGSILGVVDLNDPDKVIDGLDAVTLAAAFAEQLYGTDRSAAITSPVDAVRELFSMGTPPTVNAQALSSLAIVYRRWSANPTRFRSSDLPPSE